MGETVRIGVFIASVLLTASGVAGCSSSTCGRELCVTVVDVRCDTEAKTPTALVTLEIEARSTATKPITYRMEIINQDTKEATPSDGIAPAVPGAAKPNKETIGFNGRAAITVVAVESDTQVDTGKIYNPTEICRTV